MLKVGVIGYGYWGPNIVRNLMAIEETEVKALCDANPAALKKAQKVYPYLKMTESHHELLDDPEIEAVAIVTPVFAHYELAKNALEKGKHVFIEKPFMSSVKEAEEIIKLAEKNKLTVMVDHTFLFTGAVRKIKEVIDGDTLGDLQYLDSTRVSLGNIQPDVNVIWDLAPHDFSIIDYVIKNKPISVTAQGIDHFGRGQENIAYVTVKFENNMIAHINMNWISPMKIRSMVIGGQKKMLVWDDLETDEKIKIYDKGVDVDNREGLYRLMVDYRSGDMYSPRVEPMEALKRELIYFAQCVEKNETPINDAHAGLRVVKMLEAADKSLKKDGKLIKL